ncbi:MAG: FAD-dependent oxidoreductase [Proteobacteria bacterium]|nr:FAD-dependent oxidoreductase [Pseudomonadota bacterium]
MKKLVLIGGGHTHLETIRRLGEQSSLDVALTLISGDRYTPYSGMLPGLISGHYTASECHIDLEELCNRYKFNFIQESVTRVSHNEQRIHTQTDQHEYDLASINIGSTPNLYSTIGAKQWAIPVKPIDQLLDKINCFLDKVANAPMKQKFEVTVVGGGAAGLEILLALKYRTDTCGYTNLNFSMITGSNDILDTHPMPIRRKFHRILHQKNVTTYYANPVVKVSKEHVTTASGKIIKSDLTVWATGAAASTWPKLSNLPTTEDGFIKTDQYLKVKNINNLFAVGDIGSIERLQHPKSGVYALKQAAVLTTNINNLVNDRPLERYIPQKHALALISAGSKYAVASRNILCTSGKWVWHWKDYIDRNFMGKFR